MYLCTRDFYMLLQSYSYDRNKKIHNCDQSRKANIVHIPLLKWALGTHQPMQCRLEGNFAVRFMIMKYHSQLRGWVWSADIPPPANGERCSTTPATGRGQLEYVTCEFVITQYHSLVRID